MNFRTFRLFAAVFALTASLSLLSSPLAADGSELCDDCIAICPDEAFKETICNILCPGVYEDSLCGEDDDCSTNFPNKIYCQIELEPD